MEAAGSAGMPAGTGTAAWHRGTGNTGLQGPSPGRRQPQGDVAGAQPLVLAVCAGLECREQAVTAQPSPVHVCTGNV